MTDSALWMQLFSQTPGIILWILLVSAAFLFHMKYPGTATVVQICGGLVAFLASGAGLFANFMLQSELRQSGAGGEVFQRWIRLISTVHFIHLGGALVFALALLLAINALTGREKM